MKNFLLARISVKWLAYFYWRPGFDRVTSISPVVGVTSISPVVGGVGVYWGHWYLSMFWKR